MTSQHQARTPEQKKQESDLVTIVRNATERFQDVIVAEAEGYACSSAASAARTLARWACTS